MKIHRCQEHGYPTWIGEMCPKCQISILREALEQIAEPMDYAWYEKAEDGEAVIDMMREMARMALTKAGGE